MLRSIWLFTLTTCCLVGSVAGGEKILISNQNNGSAELLDLVTMKSLAITNIGPMPLTAAVSFDRRFALVASVGATSTTGSLAVLDLGTSGLPVVATVSQNCQVYGVDVAPNNAYAIATRMQGTTPQLQLVDLNASPPADLGLPVAIPGAGSANGVQISHDGKTAYVLDAAGSKLVVFDLTASPPTVIKVLAAHPSSMFLRLSNDGRRLLIPADNGPSGRVAVWNTETAIPAWISDIAVGDNPSAIPSFDPGNRFAVTVSAPGLTAHVMDVHAAPPVSLCTTARFGSDLRGVTVTTDGLAAWAACISCSKLFEIDLTTPSQATVTYRIMSVAAGPNSVVAFGEVHAHGVPATGTAHTVFVSSPKDAGKGYLLAASWGSRPGFAIGTRSVPLNLDALFAMSRTTPGIFQGFTGTLDRGGQARAVINIPAIAALRGFSFVVAGVVIDTSAPQGIGTITNAERIVVQ